jgi:RHS repeat-associated protein
MEKYKYTKIGKGLREILAVATVILLLLSSSGFLMGSSNNGGFQVNGSLDIPPGTLPGVVDVGPSGAASYTIPIELPEGIGGIKPSLAITYNSQAGNGLLGYGWNLAGVSAITRVPRSFYHDGVAGHIAFDANDRFALDGQRLMVISGTNGGNDSKYSTESFSFDDIRSFGGSTANPDHFKITTTDGTVLEYTQKVIVPNTTSTVYMWLLKKVSDRRGNYMEYIYTSATGGQVQLSQVIYGGNTNAGTDPIHTVTFTYTTKDNPYRDHFYLGGRKFENNLQLTQVEVSNGRKYVFTIVQNKLQEINLFQGSLKVVSPTVINWGGETNVANFQYVDTAGEYLDLEDKVSIVGDFTGNGKNEVMVINASNWKLYSMITNIKDSLITSGYFPENNLRTDVSYEHCGWYHNNMAVVADVPGSKYECFTYTVQHRLFLPYTVVDINGDGILNMCFIEMGTDEKFAFRAYDIINGNLLLKSGYQIEDIGGVVSSDAIITGDFNGNGRTDILIGRKNYQYQELDLDGPLKVHFVNLNIFGTNIYSIYAANFRNSPNNQLVSYNGHQMRVYNAIRNTQGKYTFSNIANTPYSSMPNPFAYPGDYNGDGLIDVLIYNESLKKWQLRFSNGLSSFLLQPDNQVPILGSPSEFYFENPYEFQRYHDPDSYNFSNTFKNVYTTGDFNGDGKTDIVRFQREVKIRFSCPWGGLIGPLVDPKDYIPCESIHDFVASYYMYVHYATGVGFTHGSNNKINGASFQYTVGVYPTNYPPTLISYGDGVTGSIEYLRVVSSLWGNYSGKFPLLVGDFRNNGIQQIILTSKHGHGNPREGLLQMHSDTQKNLVLDVTNGNKLKTEIDYKWLTDPSVYTLSKTPVSDPLTERHLPLRVVSGLKTTMPTLSSGMVTLSHTSYKYNTARLHRQRGFLGFKQTEVYDDISKVRITSAFDLNTTYFLPYLKEVDTRKNNILLNRVTYTPAFVPKGDKLYLQYMQKVEEQDALTNVFKISESTINTTLGTLTQTLETFRSGTTVQGTLKTEYTNNGPFNQPTLVKTTRTQGGGTFISQTQYAYNLQSQGANVQKITDSNGNETTFTYTSDRTNVETTTNLATGIQKHYFYDNTRRFAIRTEIISPDGSDTFVTRSSYGAVFDQMDTVTNINNLSTIFEYDPYGALAKTINPDNSNTVSQYGWVHSCEWYRKSFNSLGDTTWVHYDLAGREVFSKSRPAGGQMTTVATIYNTDGTLKETQSSVDGVASYIYFTNGRLRSVAAKGRTENYSYPSGTNTVTRTINGVVKTEVYNSIGQLSSVTDPGGTISYQYHASGQPSSINYNGSVTTVTYDSKGRQQTLNDPNAGITTFAYDNLNRLTSQTNANGETTQLQYDTLGRLKTKTQGARILQYSYDHPNYKGTLHTMEDMQSGVKITYNYDVLGRVTSQTERIEGENYTFLYTYDTHGRVATMTYPDGFTISNTYNGNYLTRIRDHSNSQSIIYSILYNNRSQVTQYSTLSGPRLYQTFDNHGYLKTTEIGTSQSNHTRQVILDYNFNASTLNLTSRTKRINNGGTTVASETFTYDPLDRLTRWNVTVGTNTEGYTLSYANNGNITHKSDLGLYQYQTSKPNAVAAVNNLQGSSINTRENEIIYNSFNKTAKIKMFQANYEVLNYDITYGPDDQRRKTRSYHPENGGGNTTIYVNGGLYEERTNGDRLHYIATPAGTSALVVTNKFNTAQKDIYYLYNDHLGSLIAATKRGSGVLEEFSYDPWGRRRNPNDWNDYNVSEPNLFTRGYTGHEHIDAFGLINMNGRMYDPRLGRFLSPDPYVQAPDYSQSFNRYSYVWNNPLKYTDPDGEIVWLVVGAAIYVTFFTDFGYEAQKYVSPAAVKFNLGVGSEGFHAGVETSIGVPKAVPFSYRWHWGSTYYSGAYDGGVSGHVSSNGREVTYFGLFSLSSTQYHSKGSDGTSTSQTVGRVMIGLPGLNVKYQNDWHPEWMNKLSIGFDLYDGGDRYRTAAMQVNVGPFKAGFNLFTGDPGLRDDDRVRLPGTGIHEGKEVYVSGNSNKYRSGIAYFGFGPFRIGGNSEMNRHYIQNRFAHDWIQKGRAAHFQVLDRSPKFYWYFGTGYGSGLW